MTQLNSQYIVSVLIQETRKEIGRGYLTLNWTLVSIYMRKMETKITDDPRSSEEYQSIPSEEIRQPVFSLSLHTTDPFS